MFKKLKEQFNDPNTSLVRKYGIFQLMFGIIGFPLLIILVVGIGLISLMVDEVKSYFQQRSVGYAESQYITQCDEIITDQYGSDYEQLLIKSEELVVFVQYKVSKDPYVVWCRNDGKNTSVF